MTRKHNQHHHLTYENQLLKQRVQQLEYEIQELTQTKSSQSNQHTNTLMILQHKNSELTKALLDKTKDVVKLQTMIHKQNTRDFYNNGDDLEDTDSTSSEDRDVKIYGPVPSISLIPQPIVPPPSKPKGLGPHHHRWGRYGGYGGHGWNRWHGWNGGKYGYPWFWDDDYKLYRDMSGNTHPHPQLKTRSIGNFDNPFLHGNQNEREFVVPIQKPTYVIPPAKPPHP